MRADPSQCVVVFRPQGGAEPLISVGRARDDNCVQQAWAAVQGEHDIRPQDVEAIYMEWQASHADAAFVAATFPSANVTYSFARPGPDGWDAALAQAARTIEASLDERDAEDLDERNRHVRQTGVLLPVLWSHSSPYHELLSSVPHKELVPGRLSVGVGVVGPTPRGTIGISHVTRDEAARTSIDDLLGSAFANLAEGLKFQVTRDPEAPDDGSIVVVQRDGGFAAPIVAHPAFHEQVSPALADDVLLVGMTDPDLLVAVAEGSPAAEKVRRLVLDSDCEPSEMIPTLLRVSARGVEFIDERA